MEEQQYRQKKGALQDITNVGVVSLNETGNININDLIYKNKPLEPLKKSDGQLVKPNDDEITEVVETPMKDDMEINVNLNANIEIITGRVGGQEDIEMVE